MNLPCTLLPHAHADGPRNMAVDEALLDAVDADPSRAFFRTYEWTEPTLSLGYFQSIADREADPRWQGAPIVRRVTGGGAIWHHHEVTYALVLPADHPAARRGGTLYRDVHAAIAGVFAQLGAQVDRRGSSALGGAATRPFLCFRDRDSEDLVLSGHKVVGSAQRRRRRAVLQHGSILLCRSPAVADLPGAGDLAPVTTSAAAWANLVRAQLPPALGLRAEQAELTAPQQARASFLEHTAYRNSAWTSRR